MSQVECSAPDTETTIGYGLPGTGRRSGKRRVGSFVGVTTYSTHTEPLRVCEGAMLAMCIVSVVVCVGQLK